MTNVKQAGFTALEFLLVLGLLAAAGFVGYEAYVRHQSASTGTTAKVAQEAPEAPSVNSAADLSTAETTINQIDVDSTNRNDVSQLDSQLSGF